MSDASVVLWDCCCWGEVDVEGDELDEELEDREDRVGEADDSVLTVVDELVNWGLDWMELFGSVCCLLLLVFSSLVVAMDFLRKRSFRSLIELEKSFMVGF